MTGLTNQNHKILTIGMLAEKVDVPYANLRSVFKRIQTRNEALKNTQLVEDAKGTAISAKEVTNVVKFFSKDMVISEKLFKFIEHQHNKLADVVFIKDIAKRNYLLESEVNSFCSKIDMNQRFAFLTSNIFVKNNVYLVKRTAENKFVTAFLLYKVSNGRMTSSYVPTFDNADDTLIHVTVLDSVQSETWKKGIVVGFYKHKGATTLPIVLFRNGNLGVASKIKMFPKTAQSIEFAERKTQRQPVIFTIRLNKLINITTEADSKSKDKEKQTENEKLKKFHFFHSLNILVNTIKTNHLSCFIRFGGAYQNPYIEMFTEAVTIDKSDYVLRSDFSKKAKDEFTKLYGTADFDQFEKDIREFTSNAPIRLRAKDNKLYIMALAKKVDYAWLQEDPHGLLVALQELEAQRDIPRDLLVGLMLTDYFNVMIWPERAEKESLSDILADRLEESGLLSKSISDIGLEQ